jgi:hypothetical protein
MGWPFSGRAVRLLTSDFLEGSPHRRDLVQGDVGRRLGRGSAAPHFQGQHPTANCFRHRHQPRIGPGRHDAVLRPARQGAVFPRTVVAGARGGAWPVGPVDDPHLTPIDPGRVRQRLCEQLAQSHSVDRPITQGVTRARPATPKDCRQAVANQRAAPGSNSQRRAAEQRSGRLSICRRRRPTVELAPPRG